jgi:hypothetical protein
MSDGSKWGCWEGHELSLGSSITCNKCKKGRYRGQVADTNKAKIWGWNDNCDACPTGKFSNQEGLATCDDCATGQYQTACEAGSAVGR